MARPRSETPTIREHQVDVPHKNGTIYVEVRTRVFDPDLGRYRDLKSKRIGKRDPITNEIVPCRPRRTKEEMALSKTATRKRVKAADIFDKIGETSGVDKVVYDTYPVPTAQKAISLARFFVQTDLPLNYLQIFQQQRDLPYRHGLSVDMAYQLVDELGKDTGRMFEVFEKLAHNDATHKRHVIAFDSTTVSTYSKNNELACQGFNKDGDHLETFKVTTFYSLNERRPISFELQRGNIPDITSLTNAVTKSKALGLESLEFVLDNGFISQSNIAQLCENNIIFTGMAKNNYSWVKKSFESPIGKNANVSDALRNSELIKIDNEVISCVQKEVDVTFNLNVSNSVRETKKEKRDFKLFLSFYYDQDKGDAERREIRLKVSSLAQELRDEKITWDDLTESDKKLLNECYEIVTDSTTGKLQLTLEPDGIDRVCKDAGVFCIVSNELKSPEVTLKLYRMRSQVEDNYCIYKSTMDGSKARTGNTSKIRGKELCKMLALCYQFHLQVALNNVKAKCYELKNNENVTASLRKQYGKLHQWLNDNPLRDIINWFDGIETVEVENRFGKQRWDDETTKLDKLFIEMLYEELENPSKTDQITALNLPSESPFRL